MHCEFPPEDDEGRIPKLTDAIKGFAAGTSLWKSVLSKHGELFDTHPKLTAVKDVITCAAEDISRLLTSEARLAMVSIVDHGKSVIDSEDMVKFRNIVATGHKGEVNEATLMPYTLLPSAADVYQVWLRYEDSLPLRQALAAIVDTTDPILQPQMRDLIQSS